MALIFQNSPPLQIKQISLFILLKVEWNSRAVKAQLQVSFGANFNNNQEDILWKR